MKDIVENKSMMSEANLDNTRSIEANHNSVSLIAHLNAFETERSKLIKYLNHIKGNPPKTKLKHPRLLLEMSIIDLAMFIAEHDDHNLNSIRKILIKRLR